MGARATCLLAVQKREGQLPKDLRQRKRSVRRLHFPSGKQITSGDEAFRSLHRGIVPCVPDRWKADPHRQPRRKHEERPALPLARKSDAAFGEFTRQGKRPITSTSEDFRVLAPEGEQALGEEQLDAPVAPVAQQFRPALLPPTNRAFAFASRNRPDAGYPDRPG